MSIAKYDYNFSDLNTYDYLDKETNINNHIKYMLNRTQALFKYEGLPETLPARELENLLQTTGYIAILKHTDGNIYGFNGGLSGSEKDVYNRPTRINITNPALDIYKEFEIEKEIYLFKNDSYYLGLLPLFSKYCTLLVENEITMLLSNVNNRIQNFLSANDDRTKESAETFLKRVHDGQLGVIAETKMFDSLKSHDKKDNSKLMDLVEYNQYIKASLYNEIGIQSNPVMKKERIIKAEIEAGTGGIYPLIYDMYLQRLAMVEKLNELFDLNITVDFGELWKPTAETPAPTEPTAPTEPPAPTEPNGGDVTNAN